MNKAGGQFDIERVRDATDLVKVIGEHVILKPRGREHVGLCPFHDDHSPSMAVVTHKGNAFYKCHSCGAGGDVFDFVMNYHRMDFGEALRYLAQRSGIILTPLKRDDREEQSGHRRIDVKKANAFAATFFRRTLSDESSGAAARSVIAQRGISDEMVEAFLLGASPDAWDGLVCRISRQSLPVEPFVSAGLVKPRKEGSGHYDAFRNRLMFPICDDVGNPVAFGARKINAEDEPKYLNSSESAVFSKSRTLYGLHLAKRAIIERQVAIITEGYTDVIACHQAGITNVVATLGTALTREHARILSRLCDTVILLFDGDEAGMKAADRALEVFFSERVDIKICVLPDGLDPDELLKQHDGRARFDDAVNESVAALQYKIDRFRELLDRQSGDSISGRQKRFEDFLQELGQLGFASMQGVRKQMILLRLAELMKLPIGTVEQALAAHSRNSRSSGLRAVSETHGTVEPVASQSTAVDPELLAARRQAEFDLLGLVVYEPSMTLEALDDAAESLGGARGLLSECMFRHPAAKAIAAFICSRVDENPDFTVQELLDCLEDDGHRSIASRLYFDGERQLGEELRNLTEIVRAAVDALDRCVRQERFDAAVASGMPLSDDATIDPLSQLRLVIECRKGIDRDAAAIATGVRT